MNHIFLGFDPGLGGSMAVISVTESGNTRSVVPAVYDIPNFQLKGHRDLDFQGLCLLVRGYHTKIQDLRLNAHAIVEDVRAFPKMGVIPSFALGYAKGAIQAVLASFSIPYTLVRPLIWQGFLKIGGKGTTPDTTVKKALELYPDLRPELVGPKGGLRHDRADALLMAHYALQNVALGNITCSAPVTEPYTPLPSWGPQRLRFEGK